MDGRLRSMREQRFLTQAELADLAGVSLLTVSRIERDAGNEPELRTIRKLAGALGVDPLWLRYGADVVAAAGNAPSIPRPAEGDDA